MSPPTKTAPRGTRTPKGAPKGFRTTTLSKDPAPALTRAELVKRFRRVVARTGPSFDYEHVDKAVLMLLTRQYIAVLHFDTNANEDTVEGLAFRLFKGHKRALLKEAEEAKTAKERKEAEAKTESHARSERLEKEVHRVITRAVQFGHDMEDIETRMRMMELARAYVDIHHSDEGAISNETVLDVAREMFQQYVHMVPRPAVVLKTAESA